MFDLIHQLTLLLIITGQYLIFRQLKEHEHQVLAPLTVDSDQIYQLVIEEIRQHPEDFEIIEEAPYSLTGSANPPIVVRTLEELEAAKQIPNNGAGILYIPLEIDLPEPKTEEQEQAETDIFVQILTEQMSKPLQIPVSVPVPVEETPIPTPEIASDVDIMQGRVSNPILNYDQFRTMEVIQLLPKLTPLALKQVRSYEESNQKRAQILSRIDGIIRNNYNPIK